MSLKKFLAWRKKLQEYLCLNFPESQGEGVGNKYLVIIAEVRLPPNSSD
jgi:hypothetical protein